MPLYILGKASGKITRVGEDRAIAVFVDDLDRCSPRYVVEVIDAINQIFSSLDARCVFILGMDRQIVASSIEAHYEEMLKHLERRNTPLAREYGYWFLSKIVQMSVSVPQTTPGGMRDLLSMVTDRVAPPRHRLPRNRAKTRVSVLRFSGHRRRHRQRRWWPSSGRRCERVL